MPSVLVLGALSFKGRNLVNLLCSMPEVTRIRGADYTIPQLSFLTPNLSSIFQKVDYVQANLHHKDGVARAFGNEKFDWVFNCCAASVKAEQVEQVYKQFTYDASILCANEAKRLEAGVFVHISSSMEYIHGEKPNTEDDALVAYEHSHRSKYLVKTDEEIRKIPEPTYVYGTGDFKAYGYLIAFSYLCYALNYPCPQMVPDWAPFGAVHVEDLCSAAVTSAKWYCDKKIGDSEKTRVQLFNVDDPSHVTVKDWLDAFSLAFPDYYRKTELTNTLDPKRMEELRQECNGFFLEEWLKLTEEYKIAHTPLAPYVDSDFLCGRLRLVDGSKVCRETGFEYKHIGFDAQTILVSMEEYKMLGIWPGK